MWQILTIEDKKETVWNAGNIHARIFRDAAHWQVNFFCPLSGDTRYDIAGTGEVVWFRPFLPITSFAAFLPQKFCLAPDMEAVFKIAIPPVLQMEIGRVARTDIPLFPQKLSFEGTDTINGELCTVLPYAPELLYAGPIDNGRDSMSLADAETAGPNLLVFTEAVIRNRSKQIYTFDRFIVYSETINIFEKNDSLVGDLVIIDYTETGSLRFQTISAAPAGYQLLTAGQNNSVGARFRQSAGFFKDITSMKLT
ncbi:MAG: hypothetical protein LBK61_05910 [Spirochaetaceae bacterium]|jgi:hypothetical protein|nr:hypothetical protein [Spirochaetaceae bacterium]